MIRNPFNVYWSPPAERPRSCALQLKTQPNCQNVIWYRCFKLAFIFNALNLKLEVVKFQVFRERNTKEKSSKLLNFKLPRGIIWFSLSFPFPVLPPVSASLLKFLMCFFMTLRKSPKLLSSILRFQWFRMQGHTGDVLHSLTTLGLHGMSTWWSLYLVPPVFPLSILRSLNLQQSPFLYIYFYHPVIRSK